MASGDVCTLCSLRAASSGGRGMREQAKTTEQQQWVQCSTPEHGKRMPLISSEVSTRPVRLWPTGPWVMLRALCLAHCGSGQSRLLEVACPPGVLTIVASCEACCKRALASRGSRPKSSAETSNSKRAGRAPRAADSGCPWSPGGALLGCHRRQARSKASTVGRGQVRAAQAAAVMMMAARV